MSWSASAAPETMSMAVSCEADGVHVTPSGPTPYARNGLRIAFERVMETARVVAAAAGHGGERRAHHRPGKRALLFARPRCLDGRCALPNRQWGHPAHEPPHDKIRLRTGSGATAAPLSGARSSAASRMPRAEILPRLLPSVVLKTGDRADGFLIFPADRYDSALVPLIDVETREAEEFEITLSSSADP